MDNHPGLLGFVIAVKVALLVVNSSTIFFIIRRKNWARILNVFLWCFSLLPYLKFFAPTPSPFDLSSNAMSLLQTFVLLIPAILLFTRESSNWFKLKTALLHESLKCLYFQVLTKNGLKR